jgi:hypothetical protein
MYKMHGKTHIKISTACWYFLDKQYVDLKHPAARGGSPIKAAGLPLSQKL